MRQCGNLYNEPIEKARRRFVSTVCVRVLWVGFVTMKKLPPSWFIDYMERK
jgi:hypothetical protein